jgi:GntR family transcriptional regulator, transcriptional repressor for pyruvate dehydrogenase complex
VRKQETCSNKFKEILKGIQQLIEEDGIKPGDRLLSERELSERLGAGRSSVREVLRSLELLGLISTKRGEGTFLEPYHAHHLVDLLAGFILRDQRSKEDLMEMRMLIETGAIRMAVRKATEEQINKLERTFAKIKRLVEERNSPKKEVRDFHAQIIRMANNYLLTRVWYPVIHFEEVIEQKEWMEHEYFAQKMLRYYQEIVQAFKKRQELEAMALFERIFDLMGCAH